MSDNCIFCKIIKGEIPSFTVYENELFKVIMDRFPAAPGHVLIIPKVHHEDIFDMPEEIAKEIYSLAQKISIAVKETVGAEGINIVQNNGKASGQAVFHFHLHIVPRCEGDGVQINKTSNPDTTLDELENIADQIKAALR